MEIDYGQITTTRENPAVYGRELRTTTNSITSHGLHRNTWSSPVCPVPMHWLMLFKAVSICARLYHSVPPPSLPQFHTYSFSHITEVETTTHRLRSRLPPLAQSLRRHLCWVQLIKGSLTIDFGMQYKVTIILAQTRKMVQNAFNDYKLTILTSSFCSCF